MNEFVAGCRVRCVDATPLPIDVAGALATEFEFPGGLLDEGSVYFVERAEIYSNGRTVVWLVGFPVLYLGNEIPWDGLRFRRLGERTKSARKRSARVPSEKRMAIPS